MSAPAYSVAAGLVPMFEKESHPGARSDLGSNLAQGRSTERAAEAVNVSPRSVETADDFWDHPHSAAELRARLRDALVAELGDRGERVRRAVFAALGTGPTRLSAADVLALVDEYVAQVRREERGTP
jgi:hypothetical protein